MKSAGKVLSVLSLYTAGRPVWSPERAARKLNVSLATGYRYFNTLVASGMLERLQRNRYVLGPAIVELDRQIRAADPLLKIARPVMVRLLKRVRQPATVLLCRYFRQQVMCIHEETNQADHAVSSYERGARRPLIRGATSKVILANLPPRALAEIWQDHRREIEAAGHGATFEEFKAAMQDLRKAGIATGYGEVDPGRIGVAAPLFDRAGRIAGSLSIVLQTPQGKRRHHDAARRRGRPGGARDRAHARRLARGRPAPDNLGQGAAGVSDPVSLKAHYPVVISGGGPTGLTLANLLGMYGVECLLLERHAATVHEPRAVSIDDESLRTMQAAGIGEEVFSQTVAGYGSHYFTADGILFAKVEPTGRPYGFPRRNAFRQPILERQLREALSRFAHVTAAFEHELVSFEQTADGAALAIRRADGEDFAVACDYLVGCDGASSGIRKALGLVLGGSTFAERWLIVDLENSPASSRHTVVFCNAERPCIALPGPDKTRRYEFYLHPHERDEDFLKPDTVQHLLATHDAAPGSRIVRQVIYTFHARVADRWSEGRVFLAGDAAHLTPPFAGQGMNSGLRDANNLAWKLACVVRGELGPRLLDTYQVERKDHVWAMIEMALRMGRVMAPRSKLEAFAVQNGMRVLGLYPPVRDYFAQMKFKPSPRFAQGFLVPDGRSARRTLVGRLFPQPNVRLEDGSVVRFDDMLGQGFSVVLRGVPDDAAKLGFSQIDWGAIVPSGVIVTPADDTSPIPEGIGVVAEADAKEWAGVPSRHVFVLRPDRYVMACIPLDEWPRGRASISALMAATFASSQNSGG